VKKSDYLHKVLGIRNIGKASILGAVDEIIEHHTTVTLDDLLSIGAVEDGIVYVFEGEKLVVYFLNRMSSKLSALGKLGDFLLESTAGSIQSSDASDDGNRTVDFRIF
jgi:hypothetical protein